MSRLRRSGAAKHDTSLHRMASRPAVGAGVVIPAYHPSAIGARSIFPSRVYAPDELPRLLKSGHNSRKIGKQVMKGARRGWPIFTLTLEERASCPRTCSEWFHCYGNNMQAAARIEHGAPLIAALDQELDQFSRRHPNGFMVRLHVLGDFWSRDYVRFWGRKLAQLPALHVFGFTAHPPSSEIGRAVALIALEHGWARAAIRFSGAPHEQMASRVIGAGEIDPDAILCPAQTGGTDCCATCALCWNSTRSIAFRKH